MSDQPALDPTRDADLTRRRLVQVGGATAALVVLSSGPARLLATAAAATPGYLRRAGYTDLVGTTFTAGGVSLRLAEVADLARAATEPAFAGRDDAFALTFTGPAASALPDGVHELRHARLGSFSLFLVPVGQPGAVQLYEAVVDRSVPMAEAWDDAPEPLAQSNAMTSAQAAAAAEAVAVGAEPGAAAAAKPAARKAGRVLAARLARRGGVLSTDLRLNRARRLVRVRVSVVRAGVVVASGERRLRGRYGLRLALRERGIVLPGDYELVITTVNRAGRRATTRRRVTLS